MTCAKDELNGPKAFAASGRKTFRLSGPLTSLNNGATVEILLPAQEHPSAPVHALPVFRFIAAALICTVLAFMAIASRAGLLPVRDAGQLVVSVKGRQSA